MNSVGSAGSNEEIAARAEAEQLELNAKQSRTAAAWVAAAQAWEKVAPFSPGEPAAGDVRFRIASARLQAWRADRSVSQQLAARAAVNAFLITAPNGPRRATALLWRTELGGN
jgi:hypothetical protein